MNLQDLKNKQPEELLKEATKLEIENPSSLRKQDLMFAILKKIANDGEIIRHARIRAFEIIENDPKLISNPNLKNKLLKDYKHMLEFVNIG